MTKKEILQKIFIVFLYDKVKIYYKFYCVKPNFAIIFHIIYVIKIHKNCGGYVKLQRKGEIDNDPVKTAKAEGIAIAKQQGKKFGRPKKTIDESFVKAYKEWKAEKITAVEAMKQVDMKPNTFYRRVKEYEAIL